MAQMLPSCDGQDEGCWNGCVHGRSSRSVLDLSSVEQSVGRRSAGRQHGDLLLTVKADVG